MYINCVVELTMMVDNDKFHALLSRVHKQVEELDDHKFLDQTMSSKGLMVIYQDQQYKKKVKLTINPNAILNGKEVNSDKLIPKIERCIRDYFGFKYTLDNFNVKRIIFMADIDVGSSEKVAAYVKVLQRIGKVKGFSPVRYDCFADDIGFCVEGNSNGIHFLVYDLKRLLAAQYRKTGIPSKKLKAIGEKSAGVLRVEVRLNQQKAVRNYTNETDTSKQVAEVLENSRTILLDAFMRVVPFGAFHKKGTALEIIQRQVKNMTLRRRMLRLVALVPEKKSLLLAQRALNYRRIDDVMETFAKINVSPITISKRHKVDFLKSLYSYLLAE